MPDEPTTASLLALLMITCLWPTLFAQFYGGLICIATSLTCVLLTVGLTQVVMAILVACALAFAPSGAFGLPHDLPTSLLPLSGAINVSLGLVELTLHGVRKLRGQQHFPEGE